MQNFLSGSAIPSGLVNCRVVVSTAVVQNLAVHLDNDTENVERWDFNFAF